MVVKVYRRHGKWCRFKSDRTSRRCNCTIYLQYQDRPGHQVKPPAGTTDWNQALAKAQEIEQGRIPASNPDLSPEDLTIEGAVERYRRYKEDIGCSPGTVRQIKRVLTKLTQFMAERGVTLLTQVRPALLTDFRSSWNFAKDKDNTLTTWAWKTDTQIVKTFFSWAREIAELIPSNPAAKAYRDELRIVAPKTQPLDPEEVEKIFKAVDTMPWDEEKKLKIRAVMGLMRYAGLAIMDAAVLAVDSVNHTQILAQRRKTRKSTGNRELVWVPVPAWVIDSVRKAAALNSNPRYVFWTGTSQREVIRNIMSKAIKEIFDAVGIDSKGSRMVGHRFRDTFAVEHLAAGAKLESVSRALGHSSVTITEKHYAPWVERRQKMMNDDLAASMKKQEAEAAAGQT